MTVPKNKCLKNWRAFAEAQENLWIFAYGSLMWRPDIPYTERFKAFAQGVSRRYCIISTAYRGTAERPGRVLGLVSGGTCHGMVYRVENADIPEAFTRIWQREMVSDAYAPSMMNVHLDHGDATPTQQALGFLADPKHEQYDGTSSDDTIAQIIHHAHGPMGSNLAYFQDTLRHLHDAGVDDDYLQRLNRHIEAVKP